MAKYNCVILENGEKAIVLERADIVTLKTLSEKLYRPLVKYIGRAKVAHGERDGSFMHVVELPAGNLLCYPGSDDDGIEKVPKKFRIARGLAVREQGEG